MVVDVSVTGSFAGLGIEMLMPLILSRAYVIHQYGRPNILVSSVFCRISHPRPRLYHSPCWAKMAARV